MDLGLILGNLGFDWRVALANLVNFLLILWILKRYALKPIEKAIKGREEKIKKGIEDAERASTELQMAKQTSENTILEARNEANRIIAASQKESEKIIAESRILQEEQAKQIIAKAEKSAQAEKEKMFQDLRKEVVDLVIAATGKFIKQDITKEKQEEIIKTLTENK